MKIKFLKITSSTLLTTLLFVASFNFCFSQTISDNHKIISTQYKATIECARLMTYTVFKTKEDYIKNVEAAATSLQLAKQEKENLKKNIPKKYLNNTVSHFEAMEKYQLEAEQCIAAINEELKNQEPNQTLLRGYAKKLHGSAQKAEKEHLILKEKTKS